MSIVVSSEFLDDPGCPGRGVGSRELLSAGRRSSGVGGGRMELVGGGRLSGFRKSILHGRKRSSTDAMRRLSGLEGGGDGVYDGDGADHKKLSEMYSEIIKLSSQNKINAKNSWSLDLIDHMDRMILGGNDAGLLRGQVNFQKASCTLDASIKIYSYRVDETIASTYRVLENLSRTDASGDLMEDGERDENIEVGGSMGRRRAVQRGGGVVDTVEKNVSNINISSLDAEFDVDPMFRKVSKLFNESGPKGMLLLNIPVRNGCCVAFDSCKTVKHTERSERSPPDNDDISNTQNSSHQQVKNSCSPPMVDVSLLRMKLQERLDSALFSSLPLVPQFSLFREELLHLGEAEAEAAVASNVGLATHEEELGSVYGQDKNNMSLKPAAPLYGDCDMGVCDSWCGESYGENENFLHVMEEGEEKNTGGGGMTQGSSLEETRLMLSHIRSDTGFMAGDGYSFFDPSMARLLGASKRSAGMDHWKFAVPLSTQMKGKASTLTRKNHENEDSQGGDNYTSTHQDRKPSFCIDFNAPYVDSTAFAPPPSRSTSSGRRSRSAIAPSNATQLTAQYISRSEAAVASGKDPHVLAKDLHFKPEDLTKLFLRPGFVAKYGTSSTGEGDDSFDDADGESHGPMETVADNEFDMSEAHDGSFLGQRVSDQGMFDRNGLLKVPRRAQKIEVSCSRKEKRIDVRKLKKDIWQHIDTTMCMATSGSTSTVGKCNPEGNDESEKLPPLATGTTGDVKSQPETLAFSAMLGDVSLKEEQAGVTVPYYFLCLLHLANEKGLRLEGSGDLHDFLIYPSTTTC